MDGFFKNNNGQFFGHVLSGEIEFYLNNQQYFLHAGDNVYFNSKHPFTARNKSEVGELILIGSVSNF
jgi:quercetin dioxygenase-like cupin family protein